jgi:flagellar hook-length control protein FliK
MVTLASVLNPTPGNAVTAVNGLKKADSDGGEQTFGALLSSKINDRQQARTATAASAKTSAEDKDTADAAASAQTAAAGRSDRADRREERSKEALADGDEGSSADNNSADTTLPASPAGTQAHKPLTDAQASAPSPAVADPALDGSAAQALMALLAQTALPLQSSGDTDSANAAEGAAAGGAAAGNVADSSLYVADNAASAAATAGVTDAADSAPRKDAAADAGLNAATTGDSAVPAIPAPLYVPTGAKSAAKSATPGGNVPTPDLKGAAEIVHGDRQDKASAAPATMGRQTRDDDSGAPAASVAVPQNSGGAQDVPLGSANSTLTFRKAAAPAADSLPSQAAAQAAASTLSAAGSDTAAAPVPASALISAQLGSDEWQQAIGQQVVMFSRNGQQNAELRLHPENLGTLQISMRVDTNNQMQIHLVSAHSQVRSALEDALPHLRAALAQSGISLGQSSVGSDATPNWGGNGQQSSAGGRGTAAFSLNAVAEPADNTAIATPPAATGRTAGVDTFV